MTELEEDFVQATHRAFRNVSNVLRVQQQSRTAAGGEDIPLFNLDDVQTATTAWRTEQVELVKKLRGVFEAGAYGLSAAIDNSLSLPPQLRGATVIPEVINEAGSQYLLQASNRIARLGDAAWDGIRGTLTEGFHAGESIPQLTRRVREQAQFAEARARAVARTETIMAANGGAMTQAKSQPDVLRPTTKQWLSTKDGRTRLTHRIANGQQRPLDKPFRIGGASVQFPGDPLGPAAECVNCRCITLFDVDEVDVNCGTMTIDAAKKESFDLQTRDQAVQAFSDLPAREIDGVVRAFSRINEKFPGVLTTRNFNFSEHYFGPQSATVGDWVGLSHMPVRGNIRLNSSMAQSGHIVDMWRTNVANGWWPAIRPECYGYEATMTHELAHAMHFESIAVWKRTHPGEPYDVWNMVADRLGRPHLDETKTGNAALRELVSSLGGPSEYGRTWNVTEWTAESLTEGLLAEDPSPVSRTLVEVLQEILAWEAQAAA